MPLAEGTGMCFKCGGTDHTSKRCRARVAEGIVYYLLHTHVSVRYSIDMEFYLILVHYYGDGCYVFCYGHHTGEYPYAKCFICGEVGHLSRACPENPKGLYPHGNLY